jgi:plastocyanin
MKTLLLLTLLSLNAAHAGNIVGTVRAQGKSVPDSAASEGHYDSRKYKFAEKVDYDELRDFVINIEGPVGSKPVLAPKTLTVETRRIEQKGATFSPHILPLVAGTTVEWPNYDSIFHNVFSMSETKQFDLDLYKGNPPDKKVTFDKPGRVDVFCSIHANMNCVVLVFENPCFAVTDGQGRYSITNVPAGTYKLKAWHERLPALTNEVVVPETGDVKVDFVLGIKNLPRY